MILKSVLTTVLGMDPHHRKLKCTINQGERDLTLDNSLSFSPPQMLTQDGCSQSGRISLLIVVTVFVQHVTYSPSLELLELNQAQKQEQ